MKKTVICDICGKTCKNERGLAIHIGHMHKDKNNHSIKENSIHTLKDVDLVTKNDIIVELHSLRQLILNLSNVLRQMKHDNNSVKWEPLTESFSTDMNSLMESPISGPPLGMNYGCNHGALMDELRSVLKERVLVSA